METNFTRHRRAAMLAISTCGATGLVLLFLCMWWHSRGRGTGKTVILLLHGLTWKSDAGAQIWGTPIVHGNSFEWDGMVGRMQDAGLEFGGLIRAQGNSIHLPTCLAAPTAGRPERADFFCLEFSSAANVDGLSYKALELRSCLQALRAYTGCRKVRLVAHSAGGLVARAYLQNAIPGVRYEHDVDRLITIASPHLGASLATHLGDLLGTRADSLRPEADLIRRLAKEPLPSDVLFAAIIVRGIAADARGEGTAYESFIEPELYHGLPPGLRQGGDQVVHVCSQNLSLAPCARKYEQDTGCPVHGIVVRVPDPSPNDLWLFDTTVHVAAPFDPGVQSWVLCLLRDNGQFWSKEAPDQLSTYIEYQARCAAMDLIEAETLAAYPWCEVTQIEVEQCELVSAGSAREYAFHGRAIAVDWWPRIFRWRTEVSGTVHLTFDCFGRLRVCQSQQTSFRSHAELSEPYSEKLSAQCIFAQVP